MADSFALDPNGQVVLQNGQQVAGPSTSLDGGTAGGPARAGGVSSQVGDLNAIEQMSMRTIEAMNKLTEGALKPVIDRMEKKQYYDGMSKVVQGQTLAQIEKEDPWYMNLAGPSATVRGAQAMTATTSLQQAETDFYASMPELRKQSPDAMRQYLVDQATKIGSTGDTLVDATVQAKLAEGWGPMLKTHMKEHLAWQQDDMLEKQTNANSSIGETMHQIRNNTKTGWDGNDKAAMYEQAVEQARPLPGQNRDSWQKGMSDTLTAAMNAGHFDYIEALKGSDVWNQIDPRVRETVGANYHKMLMKDAQTNPAVTDFTTNSAGFEFNVKHGTSTIADEDQLDSVIDKKNADYGKRTGASEPYYDNAQRAALHEQWMAGKLENEKQTARANAGQLTKEAQYTFTYNKVSAGFHAGDAPGLAGITLDDNAIAKATNDIFTDMVFTHPEQANDYFAKAAQTYTENKYHSPVFKNALVTGLGGLITDGGAITQSQQQAYSWAAKLYQQPNGVEALTAYVGADKATKVISILNAGVQPQDAAGLEEQRKIVRDRGHAGADKEEKAVVAGVVGAADPGWFKRYVPVIGGDGALSPLDILPETKAGLTAIVADRAAERHRAFPNISMEQATNIELARTLEGSDFVAGAVVLNKANVKGDQSLSSAVNRLTNGGGNQTNSNYQEAVRNVINRQLTERVQKAGGDIANFDPKDYVVRDGTQMGDGNLTLTLYSKDPTKGRSYQLPLVAKDVADEVLRVNADRSKRKPKGASASHARYQHDLDTAKYGGIGKPTDGY